MKHISALCLTIAATFSIANGPAVSHPVTKLLEAKRSKISTGVTAAPSGFEENKGQVLTTAGEAAPFVRYRLTQGNTSIFLMGTGIAYQFNMLNTPAGYTELERDAHLDPARQNELKALREKVRLETWRMDMVLEGANADARITAEGRSEDYTQYYGQDALDVHTYSRITYQEVYPGIDWVIFTTVTGMKYNFVLRPGANASLIQMRFNDHTELRVNEDGSLVHGNILGRFLEAAPVSLQNGKSVETSFVLDGDQLGFSLGTYDHDQVLIIDPDRIWATYYGGIDDDQARSVVVDTGGDVYLAGDAKSTMAIANEGYQENYGGGNWDAFLVKFNSAGVRQWGTYYGGTSDDSGRSCAVDAQGNVYLAGWTESDSAIAYQGFENAFVGGYVQAFLVKLDSGGVRQWATYYGGTGDDYGNSCAVDGSGNVFLAGFTSSPDSISFNGHQDTKGGGLNDAFLVKFNASGERQWATYYGGT